MWRKLCWWLVVLVYWAVTLYCLQDASPVFMDGGGLMPSFYWGDRPLPDLAEYYSHRTYYDLVLLTPYGLAALIVTIVGCVAAPRLVLESKLLSANAFVGTGIATLALLAALALASDIGSHLQLWFGPMFFLHGSWNVYDLFVLSKLFLPISGLAGAVEVANRRLLSTTLG